MRASSRSVTARSAKPTTASRSAPWPTSGAMLIACPARRTAARYWPNVRQSHATASSPQA